MAEVGAPSALKEDDVVASRHEHPLFAIVAKRTGIGLITLVVVSIIIFWATEVLPGNAAYAVLGHSATPSLVHALERQMGLNRPAVDRYWTWATGLLSGHPGTSLVNGQSVW